MASDLLGEIRREIDERLLELRPAVAEYERLLAAAAAIENERSDSAPALELAGVGALERRNGDGRVERDRAASSERRRRAPAADAGGVGSSDRGAGGRRNERGEPDDGYACEAILGALEHGSHTVAELTVVTGEGAARINRELRRLVALGSIAKTEREGKLAWSLATSD